MENDKLTSDAKPPPQVSECPNCGHDAFWTGEKRVFDGRPYLGMKCGHCFNSFWLWTKTGIMDLS